MKKAWCESAQVVLDHLYAGCELIVCIHQPRFGREFHGYVWDPRAGKTVRIVRDTIVERLLRDGFVVETQRTACPDPCYSERVRWGDHVCWKAVYRYTRDDEDARIAAAHNHQCETLFTLVRGLHSYHDTLLRLPYRSRIATDLARIMDEAVTIATHELAASQQSASA